jgi:hypothetical protein
MRLLFALSLFLALPCWAQSDAKLFTAGKVLEMVGPSLAQATIAVELCGGGDAQAWKRVVEAINRRHAHCIAQDASWKELTGKSDVLAGTWAFDSFLRTRGAEARAQGAADYCGRVPWKMVIDPAAATAPAKEAFLRDHPKISGVALDEFIAWMGWVRGLADDGRWIEAPCTDFWPEPPK